jgi:hypothetical protein
MLIGTSLMPQTFSDILRPLRSPDTSVFRRLADYAWASSEVSDVPFPDKGHRTNYSITSSARTKNDSGSVRPSAFAVLRLMVSWYFGACSTGRSAGLAPLRILSI